MQFSVLAIAVCLLLVGVCGSPASDNLLDKASVYDVSANELAPSKSDSSEFAQRQQADGAAFPSESNVTPPNDGSIPNKPKPSGTMFARLIDDIFQIPITVLQSVAKLLTNPFKQPHETSST